MTPNPELSFGEVWAKAHETPSSDETSSEGTSIPPELVSPSESSPDNEKGIDGTPEPSDEAVAAATSDDLESTGQFDHDYR
jgi:hypothetical protein